MFHNTNPKTGTVEKGKEKLTHKKTGKVTAQVGNAGYGVGEDGEHGGETMVDGHEDGLEDVEDGGDEGAEGVDYAGHVGLGLGGVWVLVMLMGCFVRRRGACWKMEL